MFLLRDELSHLYLVTIHNRVDPEWTSSLDMVLQSENKDDVQELIESFGMTAVLFSVCFLDYRLQVLIELTHVLSISHKDNQ